MENFECDDEPTQPVCVVDLCLEPPFRHRLSDSLLAPKLTPGLDLTAPNGLAGYVAGKAFDGSGRIVFVIVEGSGHDTRHIPVETWPAELRGWMTSCGERV